MKATFANYIFGGVLISLGQFYIVPAPVSRPLFVCALLSMVFKNYLQIIHFNFNEICYSLVDSTTDHM